MKKLLRLRLLSIGLLVLFALLAGCAHHPAATTAPTTITFWHAMSGPYAKALDRIVNAYNHSQTRYRVVATSQGDYAALQQKIMAAAKADTLPTIAQTTYTTVPDYVHAGLLAPFDGQVNDASLQAMYPVFAQAARYHGKVYSMPFSKSVRILYYNPKLLKQYHLSVPTSWAALQHDAAVVHKDGLLGISFDKSFDIELEGLARQNGSSLLTPSLTPQLTSAKTLQAAHVIWDMLQAGEAQTAGTDVYGSTAFLAGKSLFYAGSSASIASLNQYAPAGFTYKTCQLPTYRGKRAAMVSGNDLVLFKHASSAQQAGAADFVHYLLKQHTTTAWAEATGYVPLTPAAVHSAAYQRYLRKHPAAQAAIAAMPTTFTTPAFAGYSQYHTDLLASIDTMVATHETPERAFAGVQAKLKKILAGQ